MRKHYVREILELAWLDLAESIRTDKLKFDDMLDTVVTEKVISRLEEIE